MKFNIFFVYFLTSFVFFFVCFVYFFVYLVYLSKPNCPIICIYMFWWNISAKQTTRIRYMDFISKNKLFTKSLVRNLVTCGAAIVFIYSESSSLSRSFSSWQIWKTLIGNTCNRASCSLSVSMSSRVTFNDSSSLHGLNRSLFAYLFSAPE